MHRVIKRTWIMGLFILVLAGGLLFFLGDYTANAREWVTFSGSPHLYNGANIGNGAIVDRSGQLLLDMNGERTYSPDEATRKSTLHWLGDRYGYISAGAVSHYASDMVGYDPVSGVYRASNGGARAQLTLSAKVQNTALSAMAGRSGTVAVYNYKTGEILCAVTTPTYDPDNVPDIGADTTGKYEGVYVNRFLQSAYVPGSIYKIVTTAAALECVDGIEDMTFSCSGKIEYGTEAVTCLSWHGDQSLRTALANSCNCAFAQIAELVGKENMEKYVYQFGITESLSFDGVKTVRGNYDVTYTAPVSFAWSCIGQYTDLVNPAQFMRFMGAVAGGGTGAEPYIMAQVESGDNMTYRADPVNRKPIMSKRTAETLQEYMRNNVISVYGSGNFPGMTVCAKSGTSELGGDEVSNAMFAGFVLDDQYPLAFIVVVENGGFGSGTCVPIISRVLTACREVMDAE